MSTDKNTPKPPQSSVNLDWIDALRGIAILGVMACHCFDNGIGVPWRYLGINWVHWILAGQYGVQLFFVASAFTLARSWERRHEGELSPARNYFLRRFFRIAPLYMAGTLAYATLAWLGHGVFPAANYSWKALAANFLFIHGWMPFAQNSVMPGGWSIGVEMSFYLLVPWMVARLTSFLRLGVAWILAILCSLLCAYAAWHFLHSDQTPGDLSWPVANNSFLYFWLPTQLPVFLTGFLAYRFWERNGATPRPLRHAPLISLGLLGLAGVFGQYVAPIGKDMPQGPCTFLLAPAMAGIAATALLIALAIKPWKLFVNPVTLFLGRLSYSLYVTHFIGAWIVARELRAHIHWTHPLGALASYFAGLAACLAASIPLAMLTYAFIEKPGIALGKSLIKRLEKRESGK